MKCLLFVLSFFLFSFVVSGEQKNQTREPDFGDFGTPSFGGSKTVRVLKELYDATEGAYWKYNYHWMDPTPPCGPDARMPWQGVSCDGTSITEIFLEGNGLEGTLPASLFSDLPSLKQVFMSGNRIGGTLPSTIGLMKAWYIELHDNEITGTIPDTFSRHNVWGHLNLRNNQLYGPIPPSLENVAKNFDGELQLEGNYFDCPLPPFCRNMGVSCGMCYDNGDSVFTQPDDSIFDETPGGGDSVFDPRPNLG